MPPPTAAVPRSAQPFAAAHEVGQLAVVGEDAAHRAEIELAHTGLDARRAQSVGERIVLVLRYGDEVEDIKILVVVLRAGPDDGKLLFPGVPDREQQRLALRLCALRLRVLR